MQHPDGIPLQGEPRFNSVTKFTGELPETPERTIMVEGILQGFLWSGRQMGIDLATVVPAPDEVHFFNDEDDMRRAAAPWQDIVGGVSGISLPGRNGILVLSDGGYDHEPSTVGHEIGHFVIQQTRPTLRGAWPDTLDEAFIDLWAAWVFSEGIGQKFVAGYDGLGTISDELIRQVAVLHLMPPRKVFLGLLGDMVAGQNNDQELQAIFTYIGEKRLNMLEKIDPALQTRSNWCSIARELGLYNAVRRLTKGPDPISKWAAFSNYACPDIPLSRQRYYDCSVAPRRRKKPPCIIIECVPPETSGTHTKGIRSGRSLSIAVGVGHEAVGTQAEPDGTELLRNLRILSERLSQLSAELGRLALSCERILDGLRGYDD